MPPKNTHALQPILPWLFLMVTCLYINKSTHSISMVPHPTPPKSLVNPWWLYQRRNSSATTLGGFIGETKLQHPPPYSASMCISLFTTITRLDEFLIILFEYESQVTLSSNLNLAINVETKFDIIYDPIWRGDRAKPCLVQGVWERREIGSVTSGTNLLHMWKQGSVGSKGWIRLQREGKEKW